MRYWYRVMVGEEEGAEKKRDEVRRTEKEG